MKRVVARIAFRFCFVYLGLFCLATQISGSLFLVPNVSFRGLGTIWPLREITFWIAAHIFHVTFVNAWPGNGAAISWILFVIILAITLLLFATSRFWVHYGSE